MLSVVTRANGIQPERGQEILESASVYHFSCDWGCVPVPVVGEVGRTVTVASPDGEILTAELSLPTFAQSVPNVSNHNQRYEIQRTQENLLYCQFSILKQTSTFQHLFSQDGCRTKYRRGCGRESSNNSTDSITTHHHDKNRKKSKEEKTNNSFRWMIAINQREMNRHPRREIYVSCLPNP
jgi:hypothetical protein